MSSAIELRGLRKVYSGRKPVTAVDGLDLTVARGEVFGLLGPNGAGKTTTVEICEGLTRPTEGEVRILGQAWGAGADQALRARIGVCLQKTDFWDKQTVAEVLALMRTFYDEGRTVAETLALVSLEEKADSFCGKLSGGQKQRLAVATSLLGRPELLFLDEPTTGLDPQSRRQLWDVVREFRTRGGTVLLTTHYMEEAATLCDRVGVVDRGRMIALGSPDELVASLGGEHLVEVEARGVGEQLDEARFAAVPGTVGVRLETDMVTLTVHEVHRVLPVVLDLLEERGIGLNGLRTRHATLEDVFVNLTGRQLRDGEDS